MKTKTRREKHGRIVVRRLAPESSRAPECPVTRGPNFPRIVPSKPLPLIEMPSWLTLLCLLLVRENPLSLKSLHFLCPHGRLFILAHWTKEVSFRKTLAPQLNVSRTGNPRRRIVMFGWWYHVRIR
jgi:hypothetical protein